MTDKKPTIEITHTPSENDAGQTRIFIDGKDISCIVRDVDFHHSPMELPLITLEILPHEIGTLGLKWVQHVQLNKDQEEAVLHLAEQIKLRKKAEKG